MATQSQTFTAVDLSRVPPPDIVETLDFETIRAGMIARMRELWPEFSAVTDSDPIIKLIDDTAYQEMVWRQAKNDAARAVLLACATGADLDNVALDRGVQRFILSPGDPLRGIAPTYESDEDFRRRAVLGPEGYSVAGPEGAYIFHALSADPDVLDASAFSPAAGEVMVTVLSRSGTGEPDPDLLVKVYDRLSDKSVRPLTDLVTVQGADIVDYTINATLTFFGGPDRAIIMANARAALDRWVAKSRRLGRDITRAGIIAALKPEGVQNVVLTSPTADIVITRQQAGNCASITLIDGGVAE